VEEGVCERKRVARECICESLCVIFLGLCVYVCMNLYERVCVCTYRFVCMRLCVYV